MIGLQISFAVLLSCVPLCQSKLEMPVYILQQNGSVVMEKVPIDILESSKDRLSVYKKSREQFQPDDVRVGDKDASAVVHIKGTFPLTCEDVEMPNNVTKHHSRRKRQATGNHLVELLLFLDHELYKFWLARNNNNVAVTKATISDYYANIINHINRRYITAIRTGFSIQVVLAGLFIAEFPGTSPWTDTIASGGQADADQALTLFRNYVRDNRAILPAHDHAQLVTGYDLIRGGSTANAGLAYTPSVCTTNAVSVVEETRSQAVATVMAHELAHSLGAFHDGDGNACSSSDSFIMDSGLGIPSRANRANPWIFSDCSVAKIRTTLISLSPICTLTLQGTPIPLDSFLTQELGQKYPGDIQCEIFLGSGSKVCREKYNAGPELTFDDVCYQLQCLDRNSGRCFSTYAHDGTSCGNGKWCVSGQCIDTELAPATADNCPFGDDPDTVCTGLSCLVPALKAGPCCSTCSSLVSSSGITVNLQNHSTMKRPTQSNFQDFRTTAPRLGTTAPRLGTRPTQSNFQDFRTTAPRLGTTAPRLGTRPTQSNFQDFRTTAPRLGTTAPRLGTRPTQSNFQDFRTTAPRLGTTAPRLGTRPTQSNFQDFRTTAPRLGTRPTQSNFQQPTAM